MATCSNYEPRIHALLCESRLFRMSKMYNETVQSILAKHLSKEQGTAFPCQVKWVYLIAQNSFSLSTENSCAQQPSSVGHYPRDWQQFDTTVSVLYRLSCSAKVQTGLGWSGKSENRHPYVVGEEILKQGRQGRSHFSGKERG